MLARPMITPGRAAVPAPERARPNDTLDSAQEVASAVESLIHASAAGGRRGAGPGGQNAPGAVGSGGNQGPGSRSASNGYGPGPLRSMGDPRLTGYFRGIQRRVEPFWRSAFPDWAISEGRSGVATIAFAIQRDGSVSAVRVTRGSGVPEFDLNLIKAIRRAAPFEPPPTSFGRTPLELSMTFDALNPVVGREGPGRGRRR
jgi:TonB family protein